MTQRNVRAYPSGEWEDLFEQAPLLRLIGNTPLLPIRRIAQEVPGVKIYAKAEWCNPGGSVKDRPALWMVREALRTGKLTPDKTLLDSTSGNTGIAYALIGASLGIPVELCLPENASLERKRLITAYGTKIHYTDPLESSEGSRVVAQEMYDANPEKYFLPDQYNNVANPLAHYESTGPEIWQQTQGRVTHFLAGIGTSGTLMGTTRFLKEKNSAIQTYAVEPNDPMHGLEGLKHMATAMVPGIYHEELTDGKIPTPTERAYEMVGRLAREEGILVGASGGGAMWAALELAKRIGEGVIVTVFPDSGSRYLSTALMDLAFDE